MAPIPPAEFRRSLASLDGPAFATFVADLWARTGWDTERSGQLVVATRDGETRRLLVLPPRRFSRLRSAPTPREGIDAVLTARLDPDPGSLPSGTPDVEIVDAGDLRERALYALPASTADAVLRTHLGAPARAARWRRSDDDRLAGRLGQQLGRLGSHSQPSARAAAVGVLAVALVVVALATLAAVSGTSFAPSAAFSDGPDAGESAETSSPAAAAAPNESYDESVYDVEPTCERGPLAVAETVSAALTGGEKNRAIRVYVDFSNPDYRDRSNRRTYRAILRDAFEPIFEADRIDHGEPEAIDDDRVRVNATVVGTDGGRLEYAYELRQWSEEPYDGCWMIDQLAPA